MLYDRGSRNHRTIRKSWALDTNVASVPFGRFWVRRFGPMRGDYTPKTVKQRRSAPFWLTERAPRFSRGRTIATRMEEREATPPRHSNPSGQRSITGGLRHFVHQREDAFGMRDFGSVTCGACIGL